MRSAKGQSITEFIILLPIFFIILFGIFEATYIYRAKVTFNNATFEAARSGAIHHARITEMRAALRRGMLPLYTRGQADNRGVARARVRVEAAERLINAGRRSVEIINPTREMFQRFSVTRYIEFDGDRNGAVRRTFLPNDHLITRSTRAERVPTVVLDNNGNPRTQDENVSIQDANLLKIKTHWCYELKVPILRDLVSCVLNQTCLGILPRPSREQLACSAMGAANGSSYIALSSQAVVRMQSPVERWF
ncbi:MAG: pilus assembly protein [Gammaproteobacteria bacterium]|nr:pilus assembly protein [Gammaproteobacteria bacterium]